MSTTTTAASPASTIPGEDGQCGYQHGMAPCLPENGLECCSLNGFCGSNETYCLTEFGCQYGCVPASYFLSSTTVVTLSTTLTVSSTSSQPITLTGSTLTTATKASSSTPTTSNTAVADHNSRLSGKDIAGVVVGCIIGAILLFLIVAILWLRRSRRNARREAAAEAEAREAEAKAAAAEARRAADADALAAQQMRPSAEEPREYYGGLVQDNDFEMVNTGDANRRQ